MHTALKAIGNMKLGFPFKSTVSRNDYFRSLLSHVKASSGGVQSQNKGGSASQLHTESWDAHLSFTTGNSGARERGQLFAVSTLLKTR